MAQNTTLVEAKKEYTDQLCENLCPIIYEAFKTIWFECKTNECALKTFQEKLCLIPEWNQEVIDKKYNKICENINKELLDKLIEAVFLSNIKILSSIRQGKNKKISITIPDTKNFIHRCFIEMARRMYIDPYIIDDRVNINNTSAEIQRNIKRIHEYTETAIFKTINNSIPYEDILESYLQDINEENHEENVEYQEDFKNKQEEKEAYVEDVSSEDEDPVEENRDSFENFKPEEQEELIINEDKEEVEREDLYKPELREDLYKPDEIEEEHFLKENESSPQFFEVKESSKTQEEQEQEQDQDESPFFED